MHEMLFSGYMTCLRHTILKLQGSTLFQPQLSQLHSFEALEVDMSCLSVFDLRSSPKANRTCNEFQVDGADMARLQSLTICNLAASTSSLGRK